MKKNFITFFALSIVLSLALCACGVKKEPETAPEEIETEAIKEPEAIVYDTLVFNIAAKVKTIDPALSNTTEGGIVLCNVFEGLYMLDDKDMPIPAVAESCDVTNKGLTYTFHLRDAKWSDGQSISANDFVYAWKRVLNPETASANAHLLYYIKNAEQYNKGEADGEKVGIRAVDEKTLVVELVAPVKYFLNLTALPVYYPTREGKTDVYNGKYVVLDKNEESILLTKNVDYRNPDEVLLENIDIRQIEGATAGMNSFLSGEFDVTLNVPAAYVEKGVSDDIVKTYPMTGTYFLSLNMDAKQAGKLNALGSKVLQNEKVRKALSLAIDRERITKELRKDGTVAAFSFIPPEITNYDGTTFASKKYFAEKGDPEEARRLFEEAGFKNGEGFPILEYLYNQGTSHDVIAKEIQKMWGDVLNIDIELVEDDWVNVSRRRNERSYLISRHGWVADYNSPTAFLEMWLSKSENNSAGYKNNEYDKILIKAQKEEDEKTRDELLHEAEKILLNDMPIIPLFYYSNPVAVQEYVTGLKVSPLSYIYFDKVEIKR